MVFSVGNQYSLTSGPGVNETLLDMFNKICRRENVCESDGFGACQLLMIQEGGSCQISTIVGLYRAIGVPFNEKDRGIYK